MAALAYRDAKILARNLLLRAFFCLTPAEPFFHPGPHDGSAVARSGGQGRPRLGAARRACPCMGLSKSSTYFTAFSTSFIPVSLFDLAARFFAPTHTYGRRRAQGLSRPAVALPLLPHAPSFPGRALTAPSTAARWLWSG